MLTRFVAWGFAVALASACRGAPTDAPQEPLETRVVKDAIRRAQADLPCEDPKATLLDRGKLPSGKRFELSVDGCGLRVGYEVLCTKRRCDFRMLGAIQPSEVQGPLKGFETPQHMLPAPLK
jgi:hypothetical protein